MFIAVCPLKDSGIYINGIRLKTKKENDTMQIWVNFGDGQKEKMEEMKSYLKDNLQITDDKAFKFLSNSYHLNNLEVKGKKGNFFPKK